MKRNTLQQIETIYKTMFYSLDRRKKKTRKEEKSDQDSISKSGVINHNGYSPDLNSSIFFSFDNSLSTSPIRQKIQQKDRLMKAEKLNGRTAMVGFVAAVVSYAFSGSVFFFGAFGF